MNEGTVSNSSGAAVYVVMGVSGSGKSTIGALLAKELGAPFFDGDDFHPVENVSKMSRGMPLNDEDRYPWLEALNQAIGDQLAKNKTAVFAISALKKIYRDHLRLNNAGVRFIFLEGSYELILARMQAREGHFMRAEMLQSQFDALEVPTSADSVSVSIVPPIPNIVSDLVSRLK